MLTTLPLLLLTPGVYLVGALAALALAARPAVARLAAGGAAMIGAALGIGLALPVLLGADLPTALAAAPAPGLSLGLRSCWYCWPMAPMASCWRGS